MALQQNVENWERIASVAAGAALIAWSAKRGGHGVARKSMTTLGVGLIGRGASGYCPVNHAIGRTRRRDDTRRALGGARGSNVNEAVTIHRPPAEIFRFWRDLGNAPLFMRDVERVDVLDDRRSHWVVSGPGGVRVEFDSEIINMIENELIAWRTLPGADVASAGSVKFKPYGDGETEVIVTMQYDPPAGKAGAAVAWMTGHSPATRLREDLRRLKSVLEAGEAPTVEGQPTGRRRPVNLAKMVDA